MDRKQKGPQPEAEAETGPGVLFSSGLIAGGAIAGILLALTQIMEGVSDKLDFSKAMGVLAQSDLFSLAVFLAAAVVLYVVGKKKAS